MELSVVNSLGGACALFLRAARMITPEYESTRDLKLTLHIEPGEVTAIKVQRGEAFLDWVTGEWTLPQE